MAVTVLLEVNVKPDQVEALKEFFAKILPDTRAYDGCQGVNVFCNQDEDTNMVLIEKWDTRQHYEKYLGWRAETGVVDQIVSMISGAPSIRYYDMDDA